MAISGYPIANLMRKGQVEQLCAHTGDPVLVQSDVTVLSNDSDCEYSSTEEKPPAKNNAAFVLLQEICDCYGVSALFMHKSLRKTRACFGFAGMSCGSSVVNGLARSLLAF